MRPEAVLVAAVEIVVALAAHDCAGQSVHSERAAAKGQRAEHRNEAAPWPNWKWSQEWTIDEEHVAAAGGRQQKE